MNHGEAMARSGAMGKALSIAQDHVDRLTTEPPVGALVERLAQRVSEELASRAKELRASAERIRRLEADTRWMGQLSAALKNRAGELESMAKSLDDEAEGVQKKMLGTGQEPIHTRVDTDLAKKVAKAKEEE